MRGVLEQITEEFFDAVNSFGSPNVAYTKDGNPSQTFHEEKHEA
jgi:hypothetical protein